MTVDEAIENFLRTGSTRQFVTLAHESKSATTDAVITAGRNLANRAAWPTDIAAIEGQERAVFIQRRAAAIGVLATVIRDGDAAPANDFLVELLEHDDDQISKRVQAIVVGRDERGVTNPANPRVLASLATHLRINDRLLAAGAVAAHQLGEPDIGARLAEMATGDAFPEALTTFVRLGHEIVPLTPTMWDLYRAHVGSLAVMLSDELEKRASPAVLVYALANAQDSSCDEAILVGLRLRADHTVLDHLRELIPRLEKRGIADRLTKLITKLDTSSTKRAIRTPTLIASVATDGGPILLASKKALEHWEGARADGSSGTDYHEACAFRVIGEMKRPGGAIVVLPSHSVDIVRLPDGVIWLLFSGTLEDAWSDRENLRFERITLTIDTITGLVLQDAALSSKDARSKKERSKTLRLAKEQYSFDHGTSRSGLVGLLRLTARASQLK